MMEAERKMSDGWKKVGLLGRPGYCETSGLSLDEVIDLNSTSQMNVFLMVGASLYNSQLHHEIH
jgi:hypothetical protein